MKTTNSHPLSVMMTQKGRHFFLLVNTPCSFSGKEEVRAGDNSQALPKNHRDSCSHLPSTHTHWNTGQIRNISTDFHGLPCILFNFKSESNLLTLRYAHMWLVKCQGLIPDKHSLIYGLERKPQVFYLRIKSSQKPRRCKATTSVHESHESGICRGCWGAVALPVS